MKMPICPNCLKKVKLKDGKKNKLVVCRNCAKVVDLQNGIIYEIPLRNQKVDVEEGSEEHRMLLMLLDFYGWISEEMVLQECMKENEEEEDFKETFEFMLEENMMYCYEINGTKFYCYKDKEKAQDFMKAYC